MRLFAAEPGQEWRFSPPANAKAELPPPSISPCLPNHVSPPRHGSWTELPRVARQFAPHRFSAERRFCRSCRPALAAPIHSRDSCRYCHDLPRQSRDVLAKMMKRDPRCAALRRLHGPFLPLPIPNPPYAWRLLPRLPVSGHRDQDLVILPSYVEIISEIQASCPSGFLASRSQDALRVLFSVNSSRSFSPPNMVGITTYVAPAA